MSVFEVDHEPFPCRPSPAVSRHMFQLCGEREEKHATPQGAVLTSVSEISAPSVRKREIAVWAEPVQLL
jgi:hypothetical protein